MGKSGGLGGRKYRSRRARILANSIVCGICGLSACPHCHGEAKHCRGALGHIHHVDPRAAGGPVVGANEVAAHACCNLKQGDRPTAPEILKTSRRW